MDYIALIIGLIIGLPAGAALCRFYMQAQAAGKDAEKDRAIAVLEGQLEQSRTAQAILEQAKEQFAETAKAASSESLHANSENFLKLAEENFSKHHSSFQEMVKPLSENYARLNPQIETLAGQNKSLVAETSRLAAALTDHQKTGQWGEIQLRRVVELAEMTEYCDFAEQETLEGGGRPDLLVKLPEGRYIPVDAKASTTAFMEAGGAETGAEADAAIEKHAKAMKSHVDELARRRYGQGQDGFLDFVVMFVPGEQFLTAALRGNNDLLEYAMSRRVAIATPASLISMLWAVANGWQQSRMAQNAKEIAKAGEELHKRMNAFLGHYQKVGQELEKAVKSYNTSINAYDRNVHTQGAKFAELVGKAGEIPGDGLKQIEQTPRLSQKAPLHALPEPEDGA